MEDFEAKAIRDFATGDPNVRPEDTILFWLRKADDTLTAIHNDYIEPLFTHLNNIHPSIKWTMEKEVEGRIAMLDVTIIRNGDGTLDFDVYRKPTHTNQYIPFDSHQPLAHKYSTIHALTRRAELIPSTDELKKKEHGRIKEALTINGYPKWAYDTARYRPKPPPPLPPIPLPTTPTPPTTTTEPPATTTATTVPPPDTPQPTPAPPTAQRRGHIVLPYHSGLTEPLSRILQKEGISTSVRSRGSIRENLVKPKDQLAKTEKTGVIYVGSCAGAHGQPCAGRYVGETSRTLSSRVDEHFSTALRCPGQCKSSVMQHARDQNHHFRKSDFEVIGVEDDWFRRGIKESIHIRALNPSINENPGRHFLPPNYDLILEKNIKKPAAAAVHNSNEEILNTAPRRPGRPRKNDSTSSQTIPMEITPPQPQQQQQQ